MEKDFDHGLMNELRARERALEERERSVTAREARIGIQQARMEERALSDRSLVSEIQGANEHLLLASLRADKIAESAVARLQAKDTFLAMLGHELRNPLAPIMTALDLMELTKAPAFERERDLIRRHLTHLVRLIDELLDVARIAADKMVLRREPCSLAEIVNSAVELSRPALTAKQHDLVIRAPDYPLLVDGDRTRLVQIAANLIGNATKYTAVRGTVTITWQRHGASAVLCVRDTGIGISAQMLPTVFEEFAQEGHAIRSDSGGLGLGLAIVRSLVALHGGNVHASSDGIGRGSEFTVELPAAAPTRRRPAMATAERAAIVPRRVLLVDDDEDIVAMMRLALEKLGHQVCTAYDAATALAVASKFGPEVAILDLALPDVDGYELARRLRTLATGNTMRVIALSGNGQRQDRKRSREAGFDVHLVKPVELAVLQAAMTNELSTTEPR